MRVPSRAASVNRPRIDLPSTREASLETVIRDFEPAGQLHEAGRGPGVQAQPVR